VGRLARIVEIKSRGVRIWSRTGYDITERFPELHKVAAPSILDCELVVLDDTGRPRFECVHRKARPAATLVAFDILRVGRRAIISRTIEERRAALQRLLPADTPSIMRSRVFNDGSALLAECEQRKLEGIVSKRSGSIYRPGFRASDDWIKME
jgi:bifunctional non-homologous end joining protein LigD